MVWTSGSVTKGQDNRGKRCQELGIHNRWLSYYGAQEDTHWGNGWRTASHPQPALLAPHDRAIYKHTGLQAQEPPTQPKPRPRKRTLTSRHRPKSSKNQQPHQNPQPRSTRLPTQVSTGATALQYPNGTAKVPDLRYWITKTATPRSNSFKKLRAPDTRSYSRRWFCQLGVTWI